MLLKEGHLTIESSWLDAFCQRWKLASASLFGSALREDFGPRSDIDLLVTFQSDANWDLWELGDFQDELEAHLGRPVDVVRPENIRNPIKRKRIFETRNCCMSAQKVTFLDRICRNRP